MNGIAKFLYGSAFAAGGNMSQPYLLKSFRDDFEKIESESAPLEHVHAAKQTDEEIELIKLLRKEADKEKDAFGWHAFQALSISSVALGGILYFMFSRDGFPAVGLAALPIMLFALATCRLGDSSYSSANRHYGYELFLYRIRTVVAASDGRWKREYRNIEWEAAMRAWRVVQTSLYEAIYPPQWYKFQKPKCALDPAKHPLWFSQESLGKESGAKMYAGRYLELIHTMLLLVAAASVIILLVTTVAVRVHPFAVDAPNVARTMEILTPADASQTVDAGAPTDGDLLNGIAVFVCLIATMTAAVFCAYRVHVEKAKRRIMEDGLLSIHSCSVVWQAVVVAHFDAVSRSHSRGMTSWRLVELSKKLRISHKREWKQWRKGRRTFEELLELLPPDELSKRDVGAGIVGYSFWLAEEAASLARCAVDVPGWIAVGEKGLRGLGVIK